MYSCNDSISKKPATASSSVWLSGDGISDIDVFVALTISCIFHFPIDRGSFLAVAVPNSGPSNVSIPVGVAMALFCCFCFC